MADFMVEVARRAAGQSRSCTTWSGRRAPAQLEPAPPARRRRPRRDRARVRRPADRRRHRPQRLAVARRVRRGAAGRRARRDPDGDRLVDGSLRLANSLLVDRGARWPRGRARIAGLGAPDDRALGCGTACGGATSPTGSCSSTSPGTAAAHAGDPAGLRRPRRRRAHERDADRRDGGRARQAARACSASPDPAAVPVAELPPPAPVGDPDGAAAGHHAAPPRQGDRAHGRRARTARTTATTAALAGTARLRPRPRRRQRRRCASPCSAAAAAAGRPCAGRRATVSRRGSYTRDIARLPPRQPTASPRASSAPAPRARPSALAATPPNGSPLRIARVARIALVCEPPDGGVAEHVAQLAAGLVGARARAGRVRQPPAAVPARLRAPAPRRAGAGRARPRAAAASTSCTRTPPRPAWSGGSPRGSRACPPSTRRTASRSWARSRSARRTFSLARRAGARARHGRADLRVRGRARGRRRAPDPAARLRRRPQRLRAVRRRRRGGGLVVGAVTVLRRQKRLDVLLAAAPRILDAGATVKIVGDGPEAAALRAAADPRVVFEPFRPPAANHLRELDVYVLPSALGGVPDRRCSRRWRAACRRSRPTSAGRARRETPCSSRPTIPTRSPTR